MRVDSIHIGLGMGIGFSILSPAVGPQNLTLPVVSGTAYVGKTLTTTNGTWTGAPTFAYQWKRNGVDIMGANANSYVAALADEGVPVRCQVTATDGGSTTAQSNSLELWVPSDVTTEGWYDAVDTATITEVLGSVSQWGDKSGNTRNLIQLVGASQLQTGVSSINSLNALKGNGSQWIEDDPFPLPADGNVSVFGVAASTVVTNFSDGVFAMDDNGGGADFKLVASTSGYNGPDFRGFIQGTFGGAAPQMPLFTGFPHNGPSIYNAEFNFTGGICTGRVDGTSRGTRVYTAKLDVNAHFTVLADKNAVEKLDGIVGEVVVIRDLSAATREKLEGYFAWRWGIQAKLPVAHPYKTTPPTP